MYRRRRRGDFEVMRLKRTRTEKSAGRIAEDGWNYFPYSIDPGSFSFCRPNDRGETVAATAKGHRAGNQSMKR